jgi:hypothetical protein
MIIFDTTVVTVNKRIINEADAQLLLYTHATGAMILSAALSEPQGLVFFQGDDTHLDLFYKNQINLQTLFESTAHNVVTIVNNCECKLYMRTDVDILLNGGEKLFSQFKNI